ncbi:hypothetical protein F2P81_002366 [Scophthalmus maximus]|uniref:Uncharacterized protein n=1 Tax=Scophthalmus maximus TaxID=52904 RepID=A0A6A4TGM4_SCOMX|nr:hypothetical protein F2P81_002366 [Scophthalmus maximus]
MQSEPGEAGRRARAVLRCAALRCAALSESCIKVIGWSFEWWNNGMSHLLFPLISPENLVKVGRCDGNGELVSLPAAEIPHCFHSCLARNMAEEQCTKIKCVDYEIKFCDSVIGII